MNNNINVYCVYQSPSGSISTMETMESIKCFQILTGILSSMATWSSNTSHSNSI